MEPHASWRGGSPHQWPPLHGPYRSDGLLQTPQQYCTYYYYPHPTPLPLVPVPNSAHPSVYGSDYYSPAAMHHQPPPRYQQQGAPEDENRTICVRGLERWMGENHLHDYFGRNREVISTTVVRSRQTGQPVSEGYGLVEFASHAAAEAVLQHYNGQAMPQANQPFQLDWASFGIDYRHPEGSFGSSGASAPGFQSDRGSNNTEVYVGGLDLNATADDLRHTFAQYGEIVSIRIHSGGICGCVRFVHRKGAEKALQRFNGTVIRGEAVHIKRTTIAEICEIYVGGLDRNTSNNDLRHIFSRYGEIASVRSFSGKRFAFVKFVHRNGAEEALRRLSGTVIRGKAVYLDWSWINANKEVTADPGNRRKVVSQWRAVV